MAKNLAKKSKKNGKSVAKKNLLRLQPSTAFRDAALTEPLACVVQGVADLQPAAGETALVIGAGPIGLMFVALLREAGCHVIAAGRGSHRLETAQRLGAETVIDLSAEPDLMAAVRRSVSHPIDVVAEAVGRPETWDAAFQLVRKGGRVNFFGGCPAGTAVTFDTARIHYSNLTLLASFHHTPRSVRLALELIERGVIRGEDFVSGESPLSELPALFRLMAQGNRAVKTLIQADR